MGAGSGKRSDRLLLQCQHAGERLFRLERENDRPCGTVAQEKELLGDFAAHAGSRARRSGHMAVASRPERRSPPAGDVCPPKLSGAVCPLRALPAGEVETAGRASRAFAAPARPGLRPGAARHRPLPGFAPRAARLSLELDGGRLASFGPGTLRSAARKMSPACAAGLG